VPPAHCPSATHVDVAPIDVMLEPMEIVVQHVIP
jgi:hypothetical protein